MLVFLPTCTWSPIATTKDCCISTSAPEDVARFDLATDCSWHKVGKQSSWASVTDQKQKRQRQALPCHSSRGTSLFSLWCLWIMFHFLTFSSEVFSFLDRLRSYKIYQKIALTWQTHLSERPIRLPIPRLRHRQSRRVPQCRPRWQVL